MKTIPFGNDFYLRLRLVDTTTGGAAREMDLQDGDADYVVDAVTLTGLIGLRGPRRNAAEIMAITEDGVICRVSGLRMGEYDVEMTGHREASGDAWRAVKREVLAVVYGEAESGTESLYEEGTPAMDIELHMEVLGAGDRIMQADWSQGDDSRPDFIKNKPVVYDAAATDVLLSFKADKDDTYTKSEVEGRLNQLRTLADSDADTKIAALGEVLHYCGDLDFFESTGRSALYSADKGSVFNVPFTFTYNGVTYPADTFVMVKSDSNNPSYFSERIHVFAQDLSGKVDKVAGKGLSTEDYTTAEKDKLSALPANDSLTAALALKADVSNTYTKSEVDGMLGNIMTEEELTLAMEGAERQNPPYTDISGGPLTKWATLPYNLEDYEFEWKIVAGDEWRSENTTTRCVKIVGGKIYWSTYNADTLDSIQLRVAPKASSVRGYVDEKDTSVRGYVDEKFADAGLPTMRVNVTSEYDEGTGESVYTADKTFAEIAAYHEAGGDVVALTVDEVWYDVYESNAFYLSYYRNGVDGYPGQAIFMRYDGLGAEYFAIDDDGVQWWYDDSASDMFDELFQGASDMQDGIDGLQDNIDDMQDSIDGLHDGIDAIKPDWAETDSTSPSYIANKAEVQMTNRTIVLTSARRSRLNYPETSIGGGPSGCSAALPQDVQIEAFYIEGMDDWGDFPYVNAQDISVVHIDGMLYWSWYYGNHPEDIPLSIQLRVTGSLPLTTSNLGIVLDGKADSASTILPTARVHGFLFDTVTREYQKRFVSSLCGDTYTMTGLTDNEVASVCMITDHPVEPYGWYSGDVSQHCLIRCTGMQNHKWVYNTHSARYLCYKQRKMEIFWPVSDKTHGFNVSDAVGMFSGCSALRRTTVINMSGITSASDVLNMYASCSSLEDTFLYGLSVDIDLSASSVLTSRSLQYLVDNALNTGAITVMIHEDVYDGLSAELTAAAVAQNISFARGNN